MPELQVAVIVYVLSSAYRTCLQVAYIVDILSKRTCLQVAVIVNVISWAYRTGIQVNICVQVLSSDYRTGLPVAVIVAITSSAYRTGLKIVNIIVVISQVPKWQVWWWQYCRCIVKGLQVSSTGGSHCHRDVKCLNDRWKNMVVVISSIYRTGLQE